MARIRGARFVELPSRSHMVAPGDPAWELFAEEFSRFLGWDESGTKRAKRSTAS